MPIDAQTLFEETKCYACYGVSAPDLLKLGLLNRIAGGSSSGGGSSGALLIVNNLTDVANAATSFGNIKQAATTAATGVAELATNAETIAGTDATRIVTPAGLAAALVAKGLNTTQVIKSADQTVTNDATQTNDTELFLPMLANSFYSLQFFILSSGNDTTGDYACSLSFPALANIVNVIGQCGQWNVNVNGVSLAPDFASTTQVWPAANTARIVAGVDPAGPFLPIYGQLVLYNTTAGNIQFRFANSAAGVGRTSTTRAGSTLILTKLN